MTTRSRIQCLGLGCSLLPLLAYAQSVTPKEIQDTWVGKTITTSTGTGRIVGRTRSWKLATAFFSESTEVKLTLWS